MSDPNKRKSVLVPIDIFKLIDDFFTLDKIPTADEVEKIRQFFCDKHDKELQRLQFSAMILQKKRQMLKK